MMLLAHLVQSQILGLKIYFIQEGLIHLQTPYPWCLLNLVDECDPLNSELLE